MNATGLCTQCGQVAIRQRLICHACANRARGMRDAKANWKPTGICMNLRCLRDFTPGESDAICKFAFCSVKCEDGFTHDSIRSLTERSVKGAAA